MFPIRSQQMSVILCVLALARKGDCPVIPDDVRGNAAHERHLRAMLLWFSGLMPKSLAIPHPSCW